MNENIKFTIILICLLIALTNRQSVLNRLDKSLLILGMLFTVVSDFFLIIMNLFTIGVFFFCFVHVFYIMRYSRASVVKFLPLVLIPAFILFFIADKDLLIFFASIYAQLFILSYGLTIRSFIKKRYPFPNNYLILLGMTLFLLCDICVLLINTNRISFLSINNDFPFARQAIWFFYIPSQLFLSLSAYKLNKNLQTL